MDSHGLRKVGCSRGLKSSHPVHFFLLYNYCIELRLFYDDVGQFQQQQQQPQVQTQQQKQQSDFDLSKDIMTIKAQLLALVNRLEHDRTN